jgi:protein subunit release factor A
MSSPESNQTKDNELEKILLQVERSLSDLQARYTQVKEDLQQRSLLLERQQELKQQQEDKSTLEPIKTQLHQLQKELEALEFDLESSLLPNLFWQVVRFVGLGIVIGWLLK